MGERGGTLEAPEQGLLHLVVQRADFAPDAGEPGLMVTAGNKNPYFSPFTPETAPKLPVLTVPKCSDGPCAIWGPVTWMGGAWS